MKTQIGWLAVGLLSLTVSGLATASDCSQYLGGVEKHGSEGAVRAMLSLMAGEQTTPTERACYTMAAREIVALTISTCQSGVDSANDAILVPALLWGATCPLAGFLARDPKWTYTQLEQCIDGRTGDLETLVEKCVVEISETINVGENGGE